MKGKLKYLFTKIHRSRTLLFSYALVALGVVEANFRSIEAVLPEGWRGLAFVAIGVCTALLRLATAESIEER